MTTLRQDVESQLAECQLKGTLHEQAPIMLREILDRVEAAESNTAYANKINGILGGQLMECSNNFDAANRLISNLDTVLAALVNANGSTKNFRHYEPEAQAAVAALTDIPRWDDAE